MDILHGKRFTRGLLNRHHPISVACRIARDVFKVLAYENYDNLLDLGYQESLIKQCREHNVFIEHVKSREDQVKVIQDVHDIVYRGKRYQHTFSKDKDNATNTISYILAKRLYEIDAYEEPSTYTFVLLDAEREHHCDYKTLEKHIRWTGGEKAFTMGQLLERFYKETMLDENWAGTHETVYDLYNDNYRISLDSSTNAPERFFPLGRAVIMRVTNTGSDVIMHMISVTRAKVQTQAQDQQHQHQDQDQLYC
jgi:hypothetical protein